MSNGIVIFIEGDTEEEIYSKVIEKLHSMTANGRFSTDKLIIRNLKGIGNYKNRAVRVFTKDILVKNPGIKFDVFLCYDTDVFEFSSNPPVDWYEVEKALKEAGAINVFHVKAKHSIEDWILNDLNGVLKYLKLPLSTNVGGGIGLKNMENLFKKVNRIYVKGTRVKGFVDCLDIQVIMCSACKELKMLCKGLGVDCKQAKGK